MKKLLIILFFIISATVSGATYYVSTTGNNGAAGTIGAPWLTWQYAFNQIVAGDTLYVRGGTYNPTGTYADFWGDFYCGVYVNNRNGTSGDRIVVLNYPGEIPVLDCVTLTQVESHVAFALYNCDYWTLKGLVVTGASQYSSSYGAAGFWLHDSNYITMERCISHDNAGSGFRIIASSEGNLWKNCDSYENKDPLSTPIRGNNSDGFEIAEIPFRAGTPRTNTITGCRAWNNSDDGFDGWHNDGKTIIDSLWAWGNGVYHDTPPDINDRVGSGIKAGADDNAPDEFNTYTITNCIMYENWEFGFTHNDSDQRMYLYNNISLKNDRWGYNFYSHVGAYVLRNNVSYDNGEREYYRDFSAVETVDHNSWQDGLIVSDADFSSLDYTQMIAARKSNGSLPDITYLHLNASSNLIDAGVDVGISFNGTAPDLGAFEYSTPVPSAMGKTLSIHGTNLMVDKNGILIIIQ
jgi:hypothetical protein